MKSRINVASSDQMWEAWSLMVSALDTESSGPGSSEGRGHCVVFLGDSHSACLDPGVAGGGGTLRRIPNTGTSSGGKGLFGEMQA